ncbi:M48 family metallopeptidase [Brucella gallinifaecis]|uniref:M48 family metallopeptidase n=1 Tax=Brucella gallinifaecis TaxID=215590 RepID=A0A502BIT7_9HYPH|nr:SprT family zinc-dependent metalloprotease [Brucella gallinifaecis]TPF74054.1 M48 family metallopeptidase [Brucella gallinifaecis]
MRSAISYGNRTIDYTVSSNETLLERIRIHVHPNGLVEVETPPAKSAHEIAKAVMKRARWIDNNLRYFAKLREHALPREYVSGETHFYLGKRYQIKVLESAAKSSSGVRLMAGRIEVKLHRVSPSRVKRQLRAWYRTNAERYFHQRLSLIAADLKWVDVLPPVMLVQMKSQWGSCSPNGTIVLNPMLIKAPRECVDYVIIHELCHLQEHNHSKRFYALLERTLPAWKHTKSKLDGMAELLLAE